MFGLPANQVGAIAVLAVGALYLAWQNWGSLPAITLPWGGKAKPDRKAALSAFDDAVAYLESVHCPEGVNAMKLALPHFFHEHAEG